MPLWDASETFARKLAHKKEIGLAEYFKANMQCDKCREGQMHADKVFRLSGCLATIGFIILVPCFLLMCFAIVFGLIGTAASVNVIEGLEKETTSSLTDIEGLPAEVISDFERDNRVSDETLAMLTPAQRNDVQRLLSTYADRLTGASAAVGISALFGGGLFVIMLAISIPGFIVGLVLILRNKVWRCQMCGYVFDRV
jgi:hypothetical protein